MADLFPCPNKSDCAEEAADLVVRRNFTAELPDRNLAFAIFYPPLGFPGVPIPQFCAAPTAQAAAICAVTPFPNPPLGVQFPPIFGNAEVSCTLPDGTVNIIPANTFLAPTQAEADALAGQVACNPEDELIGNTPQTCSQLCAGQTVSYTVPANVFHALDQATANLFAFVFACATLSLYCQEGNPEDIPEPTAPNLKQSCSVPCGTGTFVYIVPYNTYRADNQAAANAVARTAACNLASTFRTCITCPASTACQDVDYVGIVELTGPLATQLVSLDVISGALPNGLSNLGPVISGVPTLPGTYDFTFRAILVGGHTITQPCQILVGGITGTLDNGTVGDPYSDSVSSSGLIDPVFAIAGGALPTGLSLATDGTISGTPSGDGDFVFVIQATGTNLSCQKTYSITIDPSTDCPDWATELNWGTATSVGDNPPTTGWVFAPENIADDSWATVGGVAAFPPTLASLQWGNTADLIYNGVGCNCNAHVFVSFGFTDPTEVVFTIQIEDITASNFLLVQTYNGNSPGTYDLPFSLPNTFGVNHTIRVSITMTATNTISGGAASVSSNGVISNI